MIGMYNTGVTVELGDIMKSGVDVWAFDYPSYYQGADKVAFEQKVVDHYRFRQIGSETVGRWLHQFRTRIREIMPYYIQLYKSQELMESIEDPFGNVDIVETFEQESTGKSNTNATSTSTDNLDREHRFSNTPQGTIENIDKYMTEASKDKDTNTGTSASSGSSESGGTTKHTLTRKGNQGVNTYAHDMKELRETYLNIDLMIIRELNDLFLGVY